MPVLVSRPLLSAPSAARTSVAEKGTAARSQGAFPGAKCEGAEPPAVSLGNGGSGQPRVAHILLNTGGAGAQGPRTSWAPGLGPWGGGGVRAVDQNLLGHPAAGPPSPVPPVSHTLESYCAQDCVLGRPG